MKVKKGDNVIILTGKDKGKKGKILRSLPKENKVIVEGVNIKKQHRSAKKYGKGKSQIIEVANSIDASNVKLWKQ